jgi:uncharacterized protein
MKSRPAMPDDTLPKMRIFYIAQFFFCTNTRLHGTPYWPASDRLQFLQTPALIATLLRALHRGNVAFLGPRRTGKTSCLEEIKANPGEFLPVLLNLEKHDTVEAWLREMVDELRKIADLPATKGLWAVEKLDGLLGRIRKINLPNVGGIEIEAPKTQPAWRKPADEFLRILGDCDLPVLFLVDEFPTFLKLVAKKKSRDEVEAVLNWFRAARHDLKDRRVRFLVTGSIGLKNVVRGLGLAPAVNEFDTFEIPPLTETEAIGLLQNLAKDNGVSFNLAGAKHILKLLGANWPILLQIFMAELEDVRLAKPPTKKQLEKIYQERLVHGSRNKYCDGMYDRLKEAFTEGECRLAREVLKACALNPDGLGREDFEKIHERLVPEPNHRSLLADELDHVLDTLKHDGYLVQRTSGTQKTQFASNILRDFWLRKTA